VEISRSCQLIDANRRKKSIPVQIHSSEGGGCSVPRSRRRLPFQTMLLGLSLALGLARRVPREPVLREK
jgi:hypothetical protein